MGLITILRSRGEVEGPAAGAAYALAASHASQLFRRSKSMLWSKRAGGGVLIAAGVATAAARN